MDRTIKVTGKGKLSVAPDQIVLTLRYEVFEKTYDLSCEKEANIYDETVKRIVDCGFEENCLKTTRYSIEAINETYRHSDKKARIGYQTNHYLKLSMPLDHLLLSRVIKSLVGLDVAPGVTIRYTAEDVETPKNTLLQNAIQDSRQKAEVLVKELGCSLKNVSYIDYSWGQIDIYSYSDFGLPIEAGSNRIYATSVYEHTPDDIDLEDTVTVVWSIDSNNEQCASEPDKSSC